MLLYATMLDICDSFEEKDFVDLVLEWNNSNVYEKNRVSDVKWNGEENIRWGEEHLWLEIQRDMVHHLTAVRYEKKEEDGSIWNTDYIFNAQEHRLAVQLDRSYTEEALMENTSFTTPHFLTLLLAKGVVKKDGDLAVRRDALSITSENAGLLSAVILGKADFHQPVVYVTKTILNQDPVDVQLLCSRLKGAAHVLVRADHQDNHAIRAACNDFNEYNGAIGIYFPNTRHRRLNYREVPAIQDVLMQKVTQAVFGYVNAQSVPDLYTWSGVKNAVLQEQWVRSAQEKKEAQDAREKAEAEVHHYADTFDQDINKLKKQVDELTGENLSLKKENQGLRARVSGMEQVPVLFLGSEEEFYPGEIKEMILDAVDAMKDKVPEKSRRRDVYQDLLQANAYKHVSEKRKDRLKKLLNGYSVMRPEIAQALQKMGFEITEEGKHYRLRYYGDNRYRATLSKTGSDWREGKNAASDISKKMF